MPGTKRKSDGSPTQPSYEYWLIKSEPESRIEKGKNQNLSSVSGVQFHSKILITFLNDSYFRSGCQVWD